MIRRIENSPSFGSTIIRDNVFKKGSDFIEKYGTNIEKRTVRQVIDFLEHDGEQSIYKIEEAGRNYPITDYVLLKDGNAVKTVEAYVNPEYNIIATLVRYAQELGAKF